jgi:HK97 family phage major capsid protein
MKRSVELRQQRAAIYEQVKALLTKAEGEKRSLDTTESESVEKMEKDMEALRKTYEAEERSENLAREMASAPGAPAPAGEQRTGIDSEEYRSALWQYVQDGERRADLNVGTASEGGYRVPTAFENQVIEALTEENVMRQLADVRRYSLDTDIPVKSGRATFAYIAEKGTYPTSAQTFGKLSLKAYKSGGIILVSEELFNDIPANIESEIRNEIVFAQSRVEEPSFVSGTGSGCPSGFLKDATTGVTTAGATAITFDEVIDLFHALKTPYRRNATWLMNDAIAKYVRKLKNAVTGEYTWQASVVADKPDTILGRPVRYSQDMDNTVAANKKTIAFGDFKYYRIADRVGISVQRLNELYAGTGQIGFRATMRNDGLLTLAEAVQVMVQHA